MRILVIGASGSGQSTLAKEISGVLKCELLDTDDFYWLKTNPPFTKQRPFDERNQELLFAVQRLRNVVLAGSILGWGQELENSFDLIVFLYVPTPVRMERLRAREIGRYGRIDPEFEAWTSKYDEPDTEVRSLAKHLAWLETRACPILRLTGAENVQSNVNKVTNQITKLSTTYAEATK